ncbi:MAG: type VI secretion system tip protein VgrG, partial [Acidobacteriota bacterium]|nr:type VI secretion system tip protein VgrG [Acidobacteriota bacterium]
MNTTDIELEASTALYMVSEHMPQYVGMPALRLIQLEGEDAVGRAFRYRLLARDARSIAADWTPCGEGGRSNADAMLGQQLGVCIALDGEPAASRAAPRQRWRWINGIVTGLRYLDADPRARKVELVLEPWLALARMRNHYRIFQEQTVAEIVRTVLDAYGWPLDMRCADSYPKLDYQVQYGETDFDFVSRLMAQWGLAYHFEHDVADPRARRVPAHTMVVTDQHTACTPQPCPAYQELPLQPRTDAHAEHDRPVIHAFDMQHSLHCSHSQVWDYDFEHPSYRLDQETTATV